MNNSLILISKKNVISYCFYEVLCQGRSYIISQNEIFNPTKRNQQPLFKRHEMSSNSNKSKSDINKTECAEQTYSVLLPGGRYFEDYFILNSASFLKKVIRSEMYTLAISC